MLVSFKIFTKATTIRISSVTGHIVDLTQTAFMHRRNILKGAIILHEAVYEQSGVIFK